MSDKKIHDMNPYQSAGTFNGISYVEREADKKLLQQILENRYYPYFLAPRQSGKSSLIAHVMKELESKKFVFVFVDFSTFSPDSLKSYDALLNTFTDEIISKVGICNDRDEISEKKSRERLQSTLQLITKTLDKRVIIFLDEIERLIDLEFKDNFFGLIRSFFNLRTTKIEANFKQVQFVLSGATQQTQLISKAHVSPFNVGFPIILRDFSLEEVIEITKHIHKSKMKVKPTIESDIYKHTKGSVYLTQLLLERLWAKGQEQLDLEISSKVVANTVMNIINESPKNIHFVNIYLNIIKKPHLILSFMHLVEGRKIDQQAFNDLEMLGIATEQDSYGQYSCRNLIYERVFGQQGPLDIFKNDEVDYSFSHLTAQCIDDHYPHPIEKLVTKHLTDQRWKEAFLLVAGSMPGGTDDLLLLMEKEAQKCINTPKLQALLNWAEQVITGSLRKLKPVGKRAIGLVIAIAYAEAKTNIIVNVNANAIAIANAIANEKVIANPEAKTTDPTYKYPNTIVNAIEAANMIINTYTYANFSIIANAKTNANTIADAIANDEVIAIVNAHHDLFKIADAYTEANANDEAINYIHKLKELTIFNNADFTTLINKLKELKTKLLDEKQLHKEHQKFVQSLQEIFSQCF